MLPGEGMTVNLPPHYPRAANVPPNNPPEAVDARRRPAGAKGTAAAGAR